MRVTLAPRERTGSSRAEQVLETIPAKGRRPQRDRVATTERCKTASSIPRQFAASPAWALGRPTRWSPARDRLALDRIKDTHARERHRPAILCRLDQHVNDKSPFLAISL